MLAKKSEQIIFSFIVGALCGLCVGIAAHDWSMAAHAGERAACEERPDSAAYYMRKPGENHSVESCEHVMRYGSPRWVPDFQSPLRPKQEGR